MFESIISQLPPTECSLKVNGTLLEDVISGFRITGVTGRESLESELSETTIPGMDGTIFEEKRDQNRPITVTFNLVTDARSTYQNHIDLLKQTLHDTDLQLIFSDLPDRYYTANMESIENSAPQHMTSPDCYFGTGTISFVCSDPYTYALQVKTARNNGANVITLINNGSKAVPVDVKATMKSDNGYIGLTLNDRFYQVGKTEEVDGVTHEETVLLFDDHLWEDKGWLLNQGVTPPVTGERLQNGTIGYVHEELIEGYVHCTDYKTGNSWHGAAVTKMVPTDVNGQYPVNWMSCWRFDFNTVGGSARGTQIGHNSVTFSDENDNIIVSVVFEDNNATLERSDMVVYIGDKRIWDTKNTTKFYITSREGGPTVNVEKIGSQITVSFSYAGIKKTFQAENKDAELRKVTWYGAAYKTYKPMTNNLLRALQVKKHNVQRYEDIPNYFGVNDVISIVGETNEVYINNIYDGDQADPGSQPLLLPPGQHTLGIVVSPFADIPDVEVSWRERWL